MTLFTEPYSGFTRLIRYWWVIVLFGLMGGILGWLIHFVRQPVYQASNDLHIGIDFTRTGFLTDIEEDQMMGLVGDVIESDTVLSLVIEHAQKSGLTIGLDQTNDIFFLERKAYEWVLHVRYPDRQWAANLVNWWTQFAYQELAKALDHAQTAANLQQQLDGLVSCLTETLAGQPELAGCPICSNDLHREISLISLQVQQERVASRGLPPAIRVNPPDMVGAPKSPALYQQGVTVLMGSFLGLFGGIIFILFDLRVIKRHSHRNQ